MNADPSTVLQRCAELAVTTRRSPTMPAVLHAATRVVVDWVAATVVGSTMPPAVIMRGALLDGEPGGSAQVVGDHRRASPRMAALLNAVASHTAEVDDIYRDGVYHPGSPTVAAALAVAQHLDASGSDLLRAVAVGYEIGDLLAEAIQPAHYRYWHTTGTIGTIGAAAAAAEVMHLDAGAFTHALATATTMAAGLQQAFRSDAMSKPLHAGHAADAGVLAALIAAQGFTGATDAFEGPAGFVPATAGDIDASRLAAIGRPDSAYDGAQLTQQARVVRTTVKAHACCGHAFAPVDAALALRTRGIAPAEIERIEVETYRTALEVAGNPRPTSAFEAKFSIEYCVAAALVLGSVQLAAFAPEALTDHRIRDLATRVVLVAAADLDERFPTARAARLRIHTRDGRELVELRDTRKGDPDDPLSDDELRAKFLDLTGALFDAQRGEALLARLWSLAETTKVRDLPLSAPTQT